MSDDLKLESAELPPDVDDAMASFMEEDDDHTEGEVGDEALDNADNDLEPDPDKKPAADPDKKVEKKPEEDPGKKTPKEEGAGDDDYPEELKNRLKKPPGVIEDFPAPVKPVEEKEPKQPDEKPAVPATPAPAPLTMEDVGNLLGDLPDQEIEVDGTKINLKEYKKDYPDDFAAIIAVGSIMAKKIVEQSLKSGQFLKADQVGPIHEKILDMEFWDQITEVHSDGKKINKSPEFVEWLGSQDAALQRMAKKLETPEDGILILNYYKKSIGKKKAETVDDKTRKEKKLRDDLHKGTLRNKKTVTQTDGIDMNDAQAAFEEDDDDDD